MKCKEVGEHTEQDGMKGFIFFERCGYVLPLKLFKTK